MVNNLHNLAFIDGQNLHVSTALSTDNPWEIDLKRFRIYLHEKYNIKRAYYYLGFAIDSNQKLYDKIQKAGFILRFRQHGSDAISNKKGNVDTEIIFDIMKKLYKEVDFDKIVLVSGDGDYVRMVKFLIEENKLEKILFPNKKYASSLYKRITAKYFANLDDPNVVKKIGKKKRRP